MTRRAGRGVSLALATTLAGCVAYQAAPLDPTPRLASTRADLVGARAAPITLRDLDRLVLRNNPDLRAARAKRGVAEAQILQAGLLPNPQIAASYPFYAGGAGGTDAFTLGIAQDLRAILLRPTKIEAATASKGEIDASLLWQEYQTLGKARLLYVDVVYGDRLATVLAKSRRLLHERLDLAQAGVQQGGAPLSSLSPDLVAVADVDKTIDENERQQLSRRHQLAALLGLAPDAPLPLAGPIDLPRLDPRRVRSDLAGIADRRPDLVSLQLGYRVQDAKLRQAIIAQFPNVVIGVLGGRDTSAIYSVGPQATFDLPIFDRNEGAVAAEVATRDGLKREFDARVAAVAGEIEALLSEQALLRRQFDSLGGRLAQARDIADKSEAGFKQGAIDERAYVEVAVARLSQEQERVALGRALAAGEISLATLVGAGLPQIHLPPPTPPDNPLGLLTAFSR